MKSVKTKIVKARMYPIWLAVIVQIVVTLAWPFVGSVQAYKCNPSDYYDDGTQTCHSYKTLTPINNGDGSVSCPTGTDHQDGNTCWGKGGDKQNYAPVHYDGTAINGKDIKCNSYHDYGDGDSPTYYYADRNSCCEHLKWPFDNTINTTGCVDPEIPQADPTDPKNQPQTTTCTGGAKPDPSTGQCPAGSTPVQTPQTIDDPAPQDSSLGTCGTHGSDNKDVQTVLVGCDSTVCASSLNGSSDLKGVPVIACILKFGVSALTVLVGVGAVAGIAWEAVQYARAQDDQGTVSNARKRIRDILIGLVVYIFMLVFINWLVPGGVIGG